MKPEQLIQALINGEISPQDFKKQAQRVKLPPAPKLPPWMAETSDRPRPISRPLEKLPWGNLPKWIDECKSHE